MHSSDVRLRNSSDITKNTHRETESMLKSVSYINMALQNKVLII